MAGVSLGYGMAVGVFAVALLAVPGCSRPGGEATEVLSPVSVALDAVDEEIREVLAPMLQAAAEHPHDGEHRGALGMALEVNGLADAAIVSYRQAGILDPQDPRWPYYEALLVAHNGELDAALELVGRSLELDSGHAPAWLWQGTWLLDLNRVQEAEAAFQKALSLGEKTAARVGIARIMLRRGDAAAALKALGPLLDSEPHPYVYKLVGEAHRRLGNTEMARLAFGNVTDAGPVGWDDSRSAAKKAYEASLGARIAQIRTLLAADRPVEALQRAETLYLRHEDHQGLLTVMSEIYRRLGRREQESRTLARAIELYPDFYSFHLKFAEHYIGGDDRENALHHLDRALELNPNVAWAHAQRGLLLAEDRPDDAMVSFQAALQIDAQAVVYYYAGMTEASRRRWPEAIGHFSEAINVDPAFVLGHVGLARSLAETGRFEDARAALDRARAVGTHAAEVDSAAAWLERRQGAQR